MVYSTCSMNPVENEAVVAEVIYHFVLLYFCFSSNLKLCEVNSSLKLFI
jgi:hypothetical protein